MKEARSTDKTAYTKFRPGRFFKDGGKWFFHTREGTFEGPFEIRAEAESRMEEYIRIAQSGVHEPQARSDPGATGNALALDQALP